MRSYWNGDPLWGFPIRCTAFSGRELLIPIRDGNVFPLSARSIINNVPGGNCAEETIQPAEDVRMVLPMGKLKWLVYFVGCLFRVIIRKVFLFSIRLISLFVAFIGGYRDK